MRKRFLYLTAVVAISLMHAPVSAEHTDSCLQLLTSSLKPGKSITILHNSGMTIDGTYLGLDTTHSLLLFSRYRLTGMDTSHYSLSELSEIRYRKGSFKFGYVIAGAVAGLLVAEIIGSSEDSDMTTLELLQKPAVWFCFIGGGTFLGVVLASGNSGGTVTVRCSW